VLCWKSNKGPTRQPLDGCCELFQRLSVSLHCCFELRPVGRSRLEVCVALFQSLDDVFVRASVGTLCRMSTARPCKAFNRCAAFSVGVQPLLSAAASNSRWNADQGVVPSNFCCFT
jgi:hypothetical protein